jgi:nucleoside-diphosphate-sugar epimerase
MRVLVTGGTGYLGSSLVPELVSSGHQVRTFDTQLFGANITPNVENIVGDIRDEAAVDDAVQGMECVIHLAGVVTDDLVDLNRDLAHAVNIEGTYNVMQSAELAGVERVIYSSSSSVYGSAGDTPHNEDSPTKPETVYAAQKLEAEKVVMTFSLSCNIAFRMATLCGPAPRMRLDTIVNIFSAQAYFKPHVIQVWDGTQFRSNLHVQDAVRAYVDAVTHGVCGVFNLSDGYHTALEIANKVKEMHHLAKVQVDPTRKDTRQYKLTSQRASELLHFLPKYGIEKAVVDNFRHFAATGLDPSDPIYTNTKRMAEFMQGETNPFNTGVEDA